MTNRIEFINLKQKFLDFYEESKNVASLQEKFKIWREQYGFAALPPTEEGQKRAFELFEKSYPNYGQAIKKIKAFECQEEKVNALLEKIKDLLNCRESITFSVIYFVGFFEGNAFVAPNGDTLALCLPIENDTSALYDDMVLAHELTHIVHNTIQQSTGSWVRPLSCLILEEGLAMRVSQAVVPGLSELHYISNQEAWYQECQNQQTEILEGILPYVKEEDADVLFRFTMGTGTTNHEREAYYVAWQVYERLLEEGFSLSDLARIAKEKAKTLVEEQIKILLGHDINHRMIP